MKNVYKFVDWEVKPLESYKGSASYKIIDKLNKGLKLSREDKKFFIKHQSIVINGIYALGGWMYDFKPFLNRFIVYMNDYCIAEQYFLNSRWLKEYYKEEENVKYQKSNFKEI